MASALLLSAARVANAQPSPHQAPKRNASAAQYQASANPMSTPSDQRSSEPPAETINKYSYSYNYYRPSSDGPPVWFQIATTIVLLAFTGGLWLTSVWQWQAIKEQADIADKTLQQSARPRLKLRAFVGSPRIVEENEGRAPDMPRSKSRIDVNNRRKLNIEFELVNYGIETALIAGSNISTHISREHGLPMKPPYREENNGRIQHPPLNQINGGTFHTFGIEFDEWIGAIEETAMRQGRFYIIGYVVYLNSRKGASTYYRTAFCRKWDSERLRFLPVIDPDYEYED